MKVPHYERHLARLCLAPDADPTALEALGGDRKRWLVYRTMVRKRLFDNIRGALPRSAVLAGDAVFDRWLSAFLSTERITSRFIRDVAVEFVDWFVEASSVVVASGIAVDLARYERAKWWVRDMDAPHSGPTVDFDFELVPVINPAHRIVRCRSPVWDLDRVDGEEPGDWRVCVARDPVDFGVASAVLEPWSWALFETWAAGGATATESVRRLEQAGVVAVTVEFVDRLCDMVALLVERHVVLGSRPSGATR